MSNNYLFNRNNKEQQKQKTELENLQLLMN